MTTSVEFGLFHSTDRESLHTDFHGRP